MPCIIAYYNNKEKENRTKHTNIIAVKRRNYYCVYRKQKERNSSLVRKSHLTFFFVK